MLALCLSPVWCFVFGVLLLITDPAGKFTVACAPHGYRLPLCWPALPASRDSSVSVSGRRGAARLLRLLAAGVSGNRSCLLRSCLYSSAASRQSDDNISVRPPSKAAKTIMGGAFSRAARGQRHDARSVAQSGVGRARSSESLAPAPAAKGKSAPKIQIQYIIQYKYVYYIIHAAPRCIIDPCAARRVRGDCLFSLCSLQL
jgi:hypothetical protein